MGEELTDRPGKEEKEDFLFISLFFFLFFFFVEAIAVTSIDLAAVCTQCCALPFPAAAWAPISSPRRTMYVGMTKRLFLGLA